jgi:copper chaperone CopZ
MLTLHISGLKCNHCKGNAEKAIRTVAGVTDVYIDLASGEAIVSGNPEKKEVVRAVEALGFKVEE